MEFAGIYQLYLEKITHKGRSPEELSAAIKWLTGYTDEGLAEQLKSKVTVQVFFAEAPLINPQAKLMKGKICGYEVSEIADPLMQQIRWLDKLVDNLAKGKKLKDICPE